jgi:hypothetical protein
MISARFTYDLGEVDFCRRALFIGAAHPSGAPDPRHQGPQVSAPRGPYASRSQFTYDLGEVDM